MPTFEARFLDASGATVAVERFEAADTAAAFAQAERQASETGASGIIVTPLDAPAADSGGQHGTAQPIG